MLKLIYAESDFTGEYVAQSLQSWVTQRSNLSQSLDLPFQIEAGRAAFLLSIEHPIFDVLVEQILLRAEAAIEVCTVDTEFVEISLEGKWIGSSDHEGVFIAELSDRIERLISQIWETAQTANI